MLKKDIKQNLQEFKKIADDKDSELKSLNILNKSIPEQKQELDQETIQRNVNLYTKDKCFNINLENGPFKSSYTRNGSHILTHSSNGYYSCFSSQNFNLCFETNLNDKIYDATFLHNEMYSAAAQEDCVFVYDNNGSELHSCREMKNTRKLDFLPYHFLLAGLSKNGFLNYLDTSIGEIASSLFIGSKSVPSMEVNHNTGVIYLGSENGVVSLWAPSQKSYLMKVSCHKSAINSINIDRSGNKLITTGSDNKLKVFDIRNTYTPLKSIKMKNSGTCTALSQRDLLAFSHGNKICVLKDFEELYTNYNAFGVVSSLEFCSHEDVLLIGHNKGISTIVVPGSGDPIFDSNEVSPFLNRKERQNHEVRSLLEKIPYDMISLKPILGEFEERSRKTMPQNNTDRYFNTNDNSNALSRFYKRK